VRSWRARAGRWSAVVLVAASLALATASCTADSAAPGAPGGTTTPGSSAIPSSPASPGSTLTVGTTDRLANLDPAGPDGPGATLVDGNIFQYLLRVPAGGSTPTPDAAQSCVFQTPTNYDCTLKPGQRFSNGDPLTSADVVFSYRRVLRIATPNGPASALANLASVTDPDPSSVVFTLRRPYDQTWPFVLGSAAGAIVDSRVFPSDGLQSDGFVVGSGPYEIDSTTGAELTLTANPDYSGDESPKTAVVALRHYDKSRPLKLAIESGAVDVAWTGLSPVAVHSLTGVRGVQVLTGPGAQVRLLAFNGSTMPGATPAQQLAIRQAIAYSVDRQTLASQVYRGAYQPAYSLIPNGVADSTPVFQTAYGATPNVGLATLRLTQAGVVTPVALDIDYTPQHFGPESGQEYAAMAAQLDGTGLFRVTLTATRWGAYSAAARAGEYPIFEAAWTPPYPDGDAYLRPLIGQHGVVSNGYCPAGAAVRPCDADGVLPLLTEEAAGPAAGRAAAFGQLQSILATGQLPFLPLLSANQVAVVRTDVDGVQDTLDPTGQLRCWLLSRSAG
jgi:peptide/nickel transport system substrate-binding protein